MAKGDAQTMDTELMKLVLAEAGENANKELAEQPLINAEVQHIIGNVYTTLGLYGDAAGHLEESYQLQRTHAGDDDLDTIEHRISLGLALLKMGDVETAEQHYLVSLEQLEALGDSDLKELLNLHDLIGQMRIRQGHYPKAEEHFRTSLDGMERTLGPQHEDTLRVRSNLAVNLQYQGRLDESETLHHATLQGRRATLGNSHPDTIQSINNMGGVLYQQDKITNPKWKAHVDEICSFLNGPCWYMGKGSSLIVLVFLIWSAYTLLLFASLF